MRTMQLIPLTNDAIQGLLVKAEVAKKQIETERAEPMTPPLTGDENTGGGGNTQEARKYVKDQRGGIIWHTQGSGKSLTMVWLAKWIRENVQDGRVLIITDRTELDEQIEKVFKGVDEDICRTKSGNDLVSILNEEQPWLLCSLVHKFGLGDDAEIDLEKIQDKLPTDFQAKGRLFVFVDECHRTQSGRLHKAMKSILPDAIFIGFTGTPLLKKDKRKSIEVFGGYIHTYKFDEAVGDGVVLDLRYEARDIDQELTSEKKIDQWFEVKTKGLSDFAKNQLKLKWGTMQQVLSSMPRLSQIVNDILLDMDTKPRLMDGRGNAMLVCASIYEACKVYEEYHNDRFRGYLNRFLPTWQLSRDVLKREPLGHQDWIY